MPRLISKRHKVLKKQDPLTPPQIISRNVLFVGYSVHVLQWKWVVIQATPLHIQAHLQVCKDMGSPLYRAYDLILGALDKGPQFRETPNASSRTDYDGLPSQQATIQGVGLELDPSGCTHGFRIAV